jgi:hypothetical protein
MNANLLLFPVLVFGVPCCAGPVELRADARSIPIVHETDKPLHCKVVADIVGNAQGKDEAAARESARNQFLNAAADHKATHALVLSESSGPVGTTDGVKAFVGGKALQCTENPPDEEASDAGSAEAEPPPPSL